MYRLRSVLNSSQLRRAYSLKLESSLHLYSCGLYSCFDKPLSKISFLFVNFCGICKRGTYATVFILFSATYSMDITRGKLCMTYMFDSLLLLVTGHLFFPTTFGQYDILCHSRNQLFHNYLSKSITSICPNVPEEHPSHSWAKVAGTTELFAKAVELLPEQRSLVCEECEEHTPESN